MTACRGSRRATSLVVFFLGALWAALPVGQPVLAQAIIAPTPLEPPAAPVPRRSPGSSDEVRVQSLDPFNPDGVGLLDPPEGLGSTLWNGTSRARAEELIGRLNQPIRSRVASDLLRRLMLSVAVVPAGRGTRSFLALRAEQLVALGDLESAIALIRATPTPIADPVIIRLRVDQMLLEGDTDGACREVSVLVRNSTDPYWQKAQVFCHILSGQRDVAALSLDILREQGQIKDPPFEALARGLIGGREPNVESLSNPTVLHLAMIRAARLVPPPDSLQSRDVRVLAAIANGGSTDLLQRIGAAERLEALGAFRAEALNRLYDRVPFRDDEIQHALVIAEAPYGVRARALLYRSAAHLENAPEARMRVIERAIALARSHGLYGTALRTNAPFVLGFAPNADLAVLADDAARASMALGRDEAARPWVQLMRARTTPATREAVANYDIAMRLAGPAGTWDGDYALLKAWARDRKGGPNTARRVAVLAVLLDAFREPDEPEQWRPPLAPDIAPSARPLLSREIRQAAAQGRKGEVALLVLILLGGQEPAAIEPAALATIIPAMVDVGLEVEARRIAVEVALTTGP